MQTFNLKDKKEYAREVVYLCMKEWSDCSEEEFEGKLESKVSKILMETNDNVYFTLTLLDGDKLIGFISLFKEDSTERKDLTPWYATMYIKKEYRGNGYSKLLNNSLKEEARKLGFSRIYLKTDLNGYYEKFGAVKFDKLNEKEQLYYMDI